MRIACRHALGFSDSLYALFAVSARRAPGVVVVRIVLSPNACAIYCSIKLSYRSRAQSRACYLKVPYAPCMFRRLVSSKIGRDTRSCLVEYWTSRALRFDAALDRTQLYSCRRNRACHSPCGPSSPSAEPSSLVGVESDSVTVRLAMRVSWHFVSLQNTEH